jgi:hypothetical protein
MTFKAKLVIFVMVEDDYGQTRLKARIGRTLQDADEYGIPFAPCKWSIGGFNHGAEFDGFEASAYIGYNGFGQNESDRGIWGLNMYYTDVRIENATQAMRIARAFAKIEKGMSDLNTKEGYLNDDSDYAGYIIRLARVLKIDDIYVRNARKQREMSDARYRKVDGSALQYFCSGAADAVTSGRITEYTHPFGA